MEPNKQHIRYCFLFSSKEKCCWYTELFDVWWKCSH